MWKARIYMDSMSIFFIYLIMTLYLYQETENV